MKTVTLDRLRFAYPGGFELGPLDLVLRAGSRTALVGPSGSGKTTLLRLVAGLEAPASGRILLDGDTVSAPGRITAPERRRIGFVFQSSALWPHMSARRHLRFAAPRSTDEEARALLARVGLAGKEDRRPAELSGGEGQRLSLARALVTRPELLLLDEPLRSVDVHLRDDLALLVREIAEEHDLTLILVTHDRDEALSMADDIAILRDGRLVEHAAAGRLLRDPTTAYGAAFFCRAACLPATESGNGTLRTAFGAVRRPDGADGAVSLVLLPGDVAVAEDEGEHPAARVLHVEPALEGFLATVAFEGQSLRVASPHELVPGTQVRLRLRGEPRVLPEVRS